MATIQFISIQDDPFQHSVNNTLLLPSTKCYRLTHGLRKHWPRLDSLHLPFYLATIKPPTWATSITLHHCGAPSLAQRSNGFSAQHLANLRHFYEVNKGWSSAPHLFVDDDQLWGMC